METREMQDVLIVGSGPGGVSAAWGLIPSRKKILMLDVGNSPPKIPISPRAFVPPVPNGEETTPKLRAPNLAFVFKDFNERQQIRAKHFAPHGSLSLGGLSNAWSCLAPTFTQEEMEGFPVSKEELLPFCAKTAKRIGISGSGDGDLHEWLGGKEIPLQPNLPLHPLSRFLLERYEKNRSAVQGLGMKMGRHFQAILTQPLEGRKAHIQEPGLHFTHTSEAVYSSAHEIPGLLKEENFSLRTGFFVERIEKQNGAFAVHAVDSNNARQTFFAKAVVLACGTLGTTRLVLKSLKKYGHPLPLLTTRIFPFALLATQKLFRPAESFGFSFWNLSYTLKIPELKNLNIYGHLMPTDGVDITELIARLPFSTPSSLALCRYLWPAMMLATCVFPGEFSENNIRLEEGNGESLLIEGKDSSFLDLHEKRVRNILAKGFKKMGILFLKNSWKRAKPGSDLHYAGTLPMSREKRELHTSPDGELYDCPGIYVADASWLPRLPAKSHTLTLMANALRVGEKVEKSKS